MLGTISTHQVDNFAVMALMGFLCFMSQFGLVAAFCVVMIASGKWDVYTQKEVLLENVNQREKAEQLYREAGYHVISRYFDEERGKKLCVVFEKKTIKLFKGII